MITVHHRCPTFLDPRSTL